MKLPNIVPTRLQRVVADEEFELDLSFDQLCEAVAKNKWAVTLGFTSNVIRALIFHHKIITKCEMPKAIGVGTDFTSGHESTSQVVKLKEVANDPSLPVVKLSTMETKMQGSAEMADDPEAAIAKLSDETEQAVKTKSITTYDTPGKGKKQCPSCKKYLGFRSVMCACGHQFKAKDVVEDKPVEDVVESVVKPTEEHRPHRQLTRDGARYRIHTPAGGSPHRLMGTDEANVERWAEENRRTFLTRNGGWLGLPALKYLVRDFHSMVPEHSGVDPATTDYAKVCRILDSLYSDPDLN